MNYSQNRDLFLLLMFGGEPLPLTVKEDNNFKKGDISIDESKMIQVKSDKSIKKQLLDGFLWSLALLIFLIAIIVFVLWLLTLFGQSRPLNPPGVVLLSSPPLMTTNYCLDY